MEGKIIFETQSRYLDDLSYQLKGTRTGVDQATGSVHFNAWVRRDSPKEEIHYSSRHGSISSISIFIIGM